MFQGQDYQRRCMRHWRWKRCAAYTRRALSPHDVLATLNRRLMIRGMPRRYTAIQYAVFNPRSHELQIASAGMPGPFHLSAGGCRNLQISGVPPGLFAAASYETLTLRLQ